MMIDKGQAPVLSSELESVLEWASRQPGWWHDSGNLNPAVLRAIANHAMRIMARETVETGCGLSTVLLSVIAESHHCFTIAAGNSLEQVQSVPHLRRDRVNFILGPSQLTVPQHSFNGPLDLVLLDGPHGFPFPQLEYFYFYQRVRQGGLLIVDDIHIPTVRQMYDFLRDDRMWLHLEDVLTTAFFERSAAPLFDPFGDNWQRQQFNQRHFEDKASMDIYCPGWREALRAAPTTPLLGGPTVAADTNQSFGASTSSQIGILRGEIERLRSELGAIQASTSWRATAPARRLVSILRDRRGPTKLP